MSEIWYVRASDGGLYNAPLGGLAGDRPATPEEIAAREALVAIPETLTRWQFFATAALAGIITQEAAQAALSGTMPQPFIDFIATLPEADRFPATMLLAGTQEFHRHHPFVQAFIASQGMTDAQADAIWTQGATLS